MKYNYLKIIIFLCIVSFQNGFSQEHFATLKKNVNSRANSLHHSLNTTKDTLLLKSASKIDYVYSINRAYEREIDKYIFSNDYKVPLTALSRGKHVFVVGHKKMKIVFTIHINRDATFVVPTKAELVTANKD